MGNVRSIVDIPTCATACPMYAMRSARLWLAYAVSLGLLASSSSAAPTETFVGYALTLIGSECSTIKYGLTTTQPL